MKQWANKNLVGISFDEVICGKGFYRATDFSSELYQTLICNLR